MVRSDLYSNLLSLSHILCTLSKMLGYQRRVEVRIQELNTAQRIFYQDWAWFYVFYINKLRHSVLSLSIFLLSYKTLQLIDYYLSIVVVCKLFSILNGCSLSVHQKSVLVFLISKDAVQGWILQSVPHLIWKWSIGNGIGTHNFSSLLASFRQIEEQIERKRNKNGIVNSKHKCLWNSLL